MKNFHFSCQNSLRIIKKMRGTGWKNWKRFKNGETLAFQKLSGKEPLS
ncbi:conserved hypothetical protein [delta proteobacterium NaphS2]|nr:conserved hypothetical protein [delta proteobacterium NaphS2]